MREITIGNKKFPFILSAAAAKEFFRSAEVETSNDPFNTDQAIAMIYRGLKDGSKTQSMFRRFINPVPSQDDLSHLLEITEILELVKDIFPKVEGGSGEKKP